DLFFVDLILGEQRFQQDHARGLNADLLADEILGLANWLLLEREERVGMLLRAHGEALDRNVLRDGKHQRRAGRNLPHLELAGSADGTPVDAGPARLERQSTSLLVVKAELLAAGLAELVAGEQPAKLHVDHRLSLGICRDAHKAAGPCSRRPCPPT